MKATIKLLRGYDGANPVYFAVEMNTVLKPGDWSYNGDILVQVNQSTCIYHSTKVIGPVSFGLDVQQDEEVEIFFKCGKEKECNYPFCNNDCPGNTSFYIPNKEKIGY